ncbi:MAG TPA: carbohydrate-binding family 9-like protein [Thermoanaerobaculia bacterium]|nr:carbohydrate-binding family 9-like protein [Thermoanaerobaculia bacterium]
MRPDSLVAVRSEFSIEDPWRSPAGAEPARLRRSIDGGAPHLATTVAVYYDDHFLSILFSGADDHLVASYRGHDDPLYDEDVVEVFLAPRSIDEYYEMEVSPIGTMFDARIVSPDGSRRTMRADRSWDSGAFAAVRNVTERDGTMTVDTLLRVPFASLGAAAPKEGESWRANFFRIDRHPNRGDEYSAWRPTLLTPPDFHLTAAFGTLAFGA